MPQITVKQGDTIVQNYSFDKPILNIGRGRDNDIVLDNLAVSRNHCRVRLIDDKFILTDLNSANGSFVNGVRVTKTEVMNEDVISIGKHKLIFQFDDPSSADEAIGDAFTADRTVIVENAPEGILVVSKGKNKGEKFKLTKYETLIGRAAENDIILGDWFVSKSHAKVIKQNNTYILKDLGSWKGSFVNEKALKEPVVLREGDELRFGSTKLSFSLHDENKALQADARRPEELGYDEAASEAPVPPAYEAEPDAEEEDDAPAGPSNVAEYGMVSDGEEVEDLNFDDLPDPDAEPAAPEPAAPEPAAPKPQAAAPSPQAAAASSQAADKPIATQLRPGVEWTDYELVSSQADHSSASAAPDGSPQAAAAAPRTPPAPAPSPKPAAAASPKAAGKSAGNGAAPLDENERMVKVWEKALENKSPVIRQQAAKMLKKLTGKDYEIPE